MDAKIIGQHIKEYRKKNNVSQRALAEQLFVSDKTISRWELGNGLPDIEQLPKLAEVLGISIGELVGAEEEQSVVSQYEEIKKREEALEAKEKQAAIEAATKKEKKKRFWIIFSSVCAAIFVCITSVLLFYRPKYTLTFVGVTTKDGSTSVSITQNEKLPTLQTAGKTVLGFVDENNTFYDANAFKMPAKNVTLRALIKEEMPLFTVSDTAPGGKLVAEHVLTEEGIPATKYTFAQGSKKDTFIQGRPVEDSGMINGEKYENMNVEMPSLGERLFLLHIANNSDIDVKIRYRVENYSDQQGGLDSYTWITLKANATTYAPVYFKNNSAYGTFLACDHFVYLDQDVEKDVELVIYGYIYTADELSGIKIEQTPQKDKYQEGELIDLTGLSVKAVLAKGSTNYSVKLINYDCDVKGTTWTKGMERATVSFAGMTKEFVLHDPFDYKIAFTPAINIESINGTNGEAYISAAYTTADDGMPATLYTIREGATDGMEVEAWIHNVVEETMANGQNLRIPTYNDTTRTLELIVTNGGTQEISFRYYAENVGDKGGVDITLLAGETKTVTFSVNPGSSIGCNYVFKLLSDVTEETNVTIHGYFHCKGDLESISAYQEAAKKVFKVGENFSSDGLVVKADGLNYDEVVIANYAVSLEEGYVFKTEDIGEKVITVSFGKYTFTYTVTVEA